jgi:hypothetical protein
MGSIEGEIEASRIEDSAGLESARSNGPLAVIAGLDPAIPIAVARPCLGKRDGRVKPGHDDSAET